MLSVLLRLLVSMKGISTILKKVPIMVYSKVKFAKISKYRLSIILEDVFSSEKNPCKIVIRIIKK